MTNHKSAFKEEAFVLEQIMELLSAGCVTETKRSDFHAISPLGVLRSGSKKRTKIQKALVKAQTSTGMNKESEFPHTWMMGWGQERAMPQPQQHFTLSRGTEPLVESLHIQRMLLRTYPSG